MDYDFSGWATRNNIECSDGRTIMKDAFKENHGQKVPLVWNHQHNSPDNVLGHAVLENRAEGVYAYCKFNNTEAGQNAKALVHNGDVDKLSIYANKLKSKQNNVFHGCIREVSLVLAGANPGAYIDSVVMHGEGSDAEEEVIIYTDEQIDLDAQQPEEKSEEKPEEKPEETPADDVKDDESVAHADTDNNKKEEDNNMDEKNNDKTIGEVFDTLSEEQKTAVYAIIGQALENKDDDGNNDEKGDNDMKHNVFDNDDENQANVLTHSDEQAIMALAKESNVGSFKRALRIYCEENDVLQHGFSDETIGQLFPEYELLKKGAPERIDGDFACS